MKSQMPHQPVLECSSRSHLTLPIALFVICAGLVNVIASPFCPTKLHIWTILVNFKLDSLGHELLWTTCGETEWVGCVLEKMMFLLISLPPAMHGGNHSHLIIESAPLHTLPPWDFLTIHLATEHLSHKDLVFGWMPFLPTTLPYLLAAFDFLSMAGTF